MPKITFRTGVSQKGAQSNSQPRSPKASLDSTPEIKYVRPDDPRVIDKKHPQYKLPPDSSTFTDNDEKKTTHKKEPFFPYSMYEKVKRPIVTGYEMKYEDGKKPPTIIDLIADKIVEKLDAHQKPSLR